MGHVADELRVWYEATQPRRRLRPMVQTFPACLHYLEPLSAPGFNRLWVATRSPRWQVAYFDGFINGGDPDPPVAYLAQRLGCFGLTITCCPQTSTIYGANQLQLFGPVKTDLLNFVWVVSATNDGGRWLWQHSGPTYDFEEPAAYERRRIRDRFTPAMLRRYCIALGVPLNDSQYTENALLDSGPKLPGKSESLAAAQERLGLLSV